MNNFHETSPTVLYESFIRPSMSAARVTNLIRNIWAAAYAKGFADSDRGHEILDKPEFVLTEVLKFPVAIKPEPTLNEEYDFHFAELRRIASEINRRCLTKAEQVKLIRSFQPDKDLRKRAILW